MQSGDPQTVVFFAILGFAVRKVAKTPAQSAHGRRCIAIVGPYPPTLGGTSAFIVRLMSALETEGYACQVFNTNSGDARRGVVERLSRLLQFGRLAWDIIFSRPQIVHCHAVNWQNLLGHSIVLSAARLLNKPTVLTLHAGDLLHVLKTRPAIIVSLPFRLPNVITTVTPELASAVRKLRAENVFFIPNSFVYVQSVANVSQTVPEHVNWFATRHRPLIVLVGAMERVHGIDILLRALCLVRGKYPTAGAMIIAYKSTDRLYRSEIDTLIAELDLADSVLFPAALPDVHSVIRMADVFVRPARSDGDSIAVREAIALGVPVVASQTGFRPQGVALFPPGDHAGLAAIIIDVLAAPRKAAPAAIDSGHETVQKYLEIYDTALRNK